MSAHTQTQRVFTYVSNARHRARGAITNRTEEQLLRRGRTQPGGGG